MMNGSSVRIWWPMYPSDFAADTMHLHNEVLGVYVKLLNAAWRADGALRYDQRYLANLTNLSLQKWRSVFSQIEDKFEILDARLVPLIHKDELQKAIGNRDKKRAAAEARWAAVKHAEAMRMQSTCNADAYEPAMHPDMQVQCPSPSPSPAPVSSCSEGGSFTTIAQLNGKRRLS
jgi:uncharacterized protein YdaU (DUF1376 family)